MISALVAWGLVGVNGDWLGVGWGLDGNRGENEMAWKLLGMFGG